MYYRFIVLVALISLSFAISCKCDEEEILPRGGQRTRRTTEKPRESTGPSSDLTVEQRNDIIIKYFEFEGISIASDFSGLDRYGSDVVEKMQEVLSNKRDFIKAYHLNSEINSMIHEAITKQVVKADAPMELADEAILQALDLIVPNSEAQPIFEMAKKDLREFYLEQPEYGKELMERLEALLDSGHLHTVDAISQLEGFYHQWTPLGRLTNFIEIHGQT